MVMSALLENKKANFNYEILEKYEAGISLYGFEVKALKKKMGSFLGSFVGVRGGEVFLMGANIPPYQPKNTPKDYDPKRVRKLLLNKKEIDKLIGFEKEKGLTIVPISLYSKGPKLKISIGIARGKKKHDKREVIKKRDSDRYIEKQMKR
jgi:SsrA-binding protein